jgi:integrase
VPLEHLIPPCDPGQPVWDISKALEGAAKRAGVKRITLHTLEHTAITLFIQSGGSVEGASDYFSTSIETIQSNY